MIRGLNHLTLAVWDLERSFGFYTAVLDARPLMRWNTGAYLLLGDIWLCLSLADDAPKPAQNYTHIALDVAPDAFATLAERLRAGNIPEWQDNKSEGASLYFLDPDGHRLEIHSGDWQSRLAQYRIHPPAGAVFYPLPDIPDMP
ncbi:VOC family protein [Thalassospira sp.]|uniref:VOC family protein n=1 Tax=Thalassospira sp. TaxID=1912094 RepID=UPI0027372492|nr:VOC family protein [Thalassospira sp.]MDP2699486.1 VOC family protein [Thalassospira sp.]